jgi:carboxypeptidase Taq
MLKKDLDTDQRSEHAMSTALPALKSRLADVHNLRMAAGLLDWDQQTYMPPGGIQARADQKATLGKLAHALFTDPDTGRLLERSEADVSGLPPSSDDGAFVRIARIDYDKATRIPPELVEEIARVTALAQEEWAKARQADDFAAFAPWLEKILDLERRTAEALGYQDRLYDALLDQYEPGMTSRQLDEIFDGLKRELIPLSRAIFERVDAVDASVLCRDFDPDLQRAFAEDVLRELGYDFQRGRQDRSVHPFCTHFSRGDVRITTRYDRNFLPMALFGSLHEMGHALYEQGVAPELDGNILGGGTSLGVHESQSRLWENLVGRSRPFWRRYFPKLKETFPHQLADVEPEAFYRAINRVSPSFIRVEADEVTYNLHIIIRYEMENELLEGRLAVKDAPEAWNARMEQYLGRRPSTDREGVLQDVHWSIGIMGYFPTYSLGNILSVQLYETAIREPAIAAAVENAEYAPLLAWMREHVHRHGRKLLPNELVRQATGSPLTSEPYVRYLKRKFGEIYGV